MWQKLTNIHRVLVPVDLTDDSLCGVEAALTYSKERKAQIYLIHVISPHEESGKKSLAMEEFFLKKIKQQLNIACIVRAGTPSDEIMRFAREAAIDLIVLPLGRPPHPGGTGIAEFIIKNATVPVVVVKPESVIRDLTGLSKHPAKHPANHPDHHTEGNTIMKYDEKYLQEIRQSVCSKCIDRTASGLCVASTFDACAINRYLPEIIDVVLATPADGYDATVTQLRTRVCSECEQQSPDGKCGMRDDVECALDRYFPLVIEAIREAARK